MGGASLFVTADFIIKYHTGIMDDQRLGLRQHNTAVSIDEDEIQSDDDDLMMNVELPNEASIFVKSAPARQKPEDDLEWNDRAILECFQMAVDSHMGKHSAGDNNWDAPKSRTESAETIRSIPLPSWAVDPLLYFVSKEGKSSSRNTTEGSSIVSSATRSLQGKKDSC